MTTTSKNKMLAIFVLYKISIEDCISFKTFTQFYNKSSELNIEILIINNTENEILLENDKAAYKVINANNTKKLAGAYNIGLEYATKLGFSWILLIDQDTEFTQDYFIKLGQYFRKTISNNIVSVVPFLFEKSIKLSPHKISKFGWWDNEIVHSGTQTGHVVAFNSLSLLKVDFINSICGFNINYPLDMLDHWCYLQIFKNKKKIYVLDCKIQHQLSVTEYHKRVSLSRHKELLVAEKKITKEMGPRYYSTYKFRLIFRLVKQYLTIPDKRYAGYIFKTLFY
jgi:GT2 family glycosyltransferase